jgi:hypothetical protein
MNTWRKPSGLDEPPICGGVHGLVTVPAQEVGPVVRGGSTPARGSNWRTSRRIGRLWRGGWMNGHIPEDKAIVAIRSPELSRSL